MENDSIYTQPQYPLEEDSISLMDIFLILVKNLKLIIITPTIICIGTIIYIFLFTSPVYVSSAIFMSSSSGGQQSQMAGLASQFGFPISRNEAAQWSYMDVIESRTLARSMLNRKFDTVEYGSQKTLLQILTYGDEEPSVGIDTLIIDGIGAVQGMIEVSASGNMYELEISSFEPKLSSDVAIAVMDELSRHQREYNARKATETRQFIEKRLIGTKIELETAEEILKEFRERNRTIIESPQLQLEQERLLRDVAVIIGVFTTLKQQLETAKIDEVKESDYVVILDKPEIPLHPARSKKKLMFILAGFFGIGLSIILAFIREYVQNRDSEEKEKMNKAKFLIVKNITDFLPSRFRKI